MILELNDDNFESVIANGPVIVDFWADWCGPCRMLAPTLEELAKENMDITIAKINVDEFPVIASKQGVMSIPTLLFFKNGTLVDTSIGVVSKAVLERKLFDIRG